MDPISLEDLALLDVLKDRPAGRTDPRRQRDPPAHGGQRLIVDDENGLRLTTAKVDEGPQHRRRRRRRDRRSHCRNAATARPTGTATRRPGGLIAPKPDARIAAPPRGFFRRRRAWGARRIDHDAMKSLAAAAPARAGDGPPRRGRGTARTAVRGAVRHLRRLATAVDRHGEGASAPGSWPARPRRTRRGRCCSPRELLQLDDETWLVSDLGSWGTARGAVWTLARRRHARETVEAAVRAQPAACAGPRRGREGLCRRDEPDLPLRSARRGSFRQHRNRRRGTSPTTACTRTGTRCRRSRSHKTAHCWSTSARRPTSAWTRG